MTEDTAFTERALKLLDAPLDPSRVKAMDDGPQAGIPYLDGEDVVRKANEIFGLGNWGYKAVGRPWRVRDEDKNGKPYTTWFAMVELTVRGGETFSDVGTNTQSGPGGPATEMASKGAVTDGLKRCLKNYGDQFGLVLRDKSMTRRELEEDYRHYAGEQKATGAPGMTDPAPLAAPADDIEQSGQLAKTAPRPNQGPPFGQEEQTNTSPWTNAYLNDLLSSSGLKMADLGRVSGRLSGLTTKNYREAIDGYLADHTGSTLQGLIEEAVIAKASEREPVGATG